MVDGGGLDAVELLLSLQTPAAHVPGTKDLTLSASSKVAKASPSPPKIMTMRLEIHGRPCVKQARLRYYITP